MLSNLMEFHIIWLNYLMVLTCEYQIWLNSIKFDPMLFWSD